MPFPLEEIAVLIGLLLGVYILYFLLKLHYIFAFGLVQKTSLSDVRKAKIEKIKYSVLFTLKLLLTIGLVAMLTFGSMMLLEGMSLKAFVIDNWQKIPEGFWLSLLYTLVRIAILIMVFRYLFKKIFAFLESQKAKTIAKNVYQKERVEMVYLRFENTIKYTFVLGVVYRITHFFPFLSAVSAVMLDFVVLFFVLACIVTLREIRLMYRHKVDSGR